MKRLRVYKLTIENQDKEFYLLNRLFEEHVTSDSPLAKAKKSREVIYVANSKDKVRRIREYLRDRKRIVFSPRFVTIWPLFDLLYDILPPEKRLTKRLITDVYANVILRHILMNKQGYLFPSGDFSLSPETSDFFLEWVRQIKEYNLHLKYRGGEIKYRKDALHFDLVNKENRFNERLLSVLEKVFIMYQGFLKENNLVDESDKRWWTIDHLKPDLLKEYYFYIEHLSILRRIEQHLFRKIYKGAAAISLLDFTFPFPGTQFTTTGIIEGEKEIIEVNNTKEGPAVQKIKLLPYEKKEHEVEGIAKKVNRDDIDKKIVIVSPAIEEYEKIFERVFPLYSIDPPSLAQRKLSEFPVIKTCLAVFEIIHQHIRRRAVVSFLLSPYIKLLKEKERRMIDRKTREEKIVSGDDWKRLKDKGTEMIRVLNFIRELTVLESKKGVAFIDAYLALLDSLLNIQDENDIRAYNKFLEFILSFKRGPVVKTISEFGIKDFQNIILSYTESVKLRVDKDVNERIEMLNIEETGGMNFARVFLIGLVEGKLPKEPKHNPLFSEKLLEEMGFPTYDMLYSLSKFNFESVTKSAYNVYCSYYKKDEKGNVFLKSPFLQYIAKEEEIREEESIDTLLEWQIGIGEIIHRGEDINETLLTQDMKKRALFIKDGVKRIRDRDRLRNVKEILETTKEFLGYTKNKIKQLSKGISPLALEKYKRCPYNFFLSYILRVGESEEPEEGMDSLIRGKVIHRILADFYKRRLARRIDNNLINDWEELKEIALNAIEEMVPGTRDRILLRLELVSKDYESLLKKFLKNEMKENFGHTVEDVEWQFAGKDVNIRLDGEKLGLVGRIDRIDKDSNGFVLFDYKTGSKKNLPTERKIEEGESFQFPIYNYAVENCLGKVAKTTYYVINSKEGVLLEGRVKIPNELFISNIFSVWRQIKALNFEPKPRLDCITRCPFNELCPETS